MIILLIQIVANFRANNLMKLPKKEGYFHHGRVAFLTQMNLRGFEGDLFFAFGFREDLPQVDSG
jgi:hypothetical protein